jgi:vitamin B12 transporter
MRPLFQLDATSGAAGRPRASITAKPGDRRSPQPDGEKSPAGQPSAPAREGEEENMSKNPLWLLLSVFAFCIPVPHSHAQTNLPDAHLTGTLLDASGGGIGGVHVSAQLDGQPQAEIWKATSTTDGKYDLRFPPGRYHIVFARSPFTSRDFVLEFAPGETRTLDLRMELERLSANVVVTAEAEPQEIQETTAPVTVITREQIEKQQAVTMPDLLLYTPGVSIGRTGPEGATASIFLNGGNSSYTKVLVDGTPVNEPGNAVDFSNFTLDNIDKVEIVRGAESAIYGTDAVAGVIQVFTHRGTTRVPEFSAFSEGGNFATNRGGAQTSGMLGAFDYSAAGSYFSTSGPEDENRFLNRTLSGNFGYRLAENNQLRLTLRNNTSSAQTPGQTLFTPPNLDEHTDYHFFSASARWDFASGMHWHHELRGAESYNRELIANPVQSFYATDPLAGCPQTSPSAVATAEFCDFPFTDRNQYNRSSVDAQTSYLLPNFAATAGYQYELENGTLQSLTGSSFSGPHLRRNNQGGFLDFRYLPHPRAALNFGARAEANAVFGTRVVPRVGASLALLQGRGFWGETRFRAFYGEGIKEPRFDQTFGTDPCFPGNPKLKPEESKTWSVGLEQKLAENRARVSADYFSNRFFDIISFTFCTPGFPCPVTPPPGCPSGFGSYFNTDLARARGVNLSGEVESLRWLRLAGNYTYDDSRVIKSPNATDPALIPGNHLIRRPVNSGSLTLNAGFRRINVMLLAYFSGVRTDSDFLGLGLTRNPGYARFDFAASCEVAHGVSFYTRVINLFDKRYQDALGYPALGREVRAGVKYRFGGRN